MKKLCDLILEKEDWLLERVLYYARMRNYTKYTSTLKEAWRMSIAGLSGTIITALQNYNRSLELQPDDDYVQDPISAYGITQAKKHRLRGINLGMFLGLLKYYRQSYIDLVRSAEFEKEITEFYRLFIGRIYDRIEIGVCLEWSQENERNRFVDSLQEANQFIMNEKNKYLTICESISNPTFFINENYQIDYMNHAAAILFNTSHTPGAGYYGFDQSKQFVPWLIDEFNTMIAGHHPELLFEKTVHTSDGIMFYEVKMKRMLDISGKFTGTVVTMVDITERKKAEQALKDSEEMLFREKEQLATTLRSIGDGVIATDCTGRVTLINSVAEALTGYNSAEAVGRPVEKVFHIVHEDTYEPVENPVKKVFETGLVTGLANHTALIARDGTFISIADSAAPIKDVNNRTLGAVLVFRDVTEQRQREEILKRYQLLSMYARDIILFVRPDGYIVEANEAAVKAYGYTREELMQKTIYELIAYQSSDLTSYRITGALLMDMIKSS